MGAPQPWASACQGGWCYCVSGRGQAGIGWDARGQGSLPEAPGGAGSWLCETTPHPLPGLRSGGWRFWSPSRQARVPALPCPPLSLARCPQLTGALSASVPEGGSSRRSEAPREGGRPRCSASPWPRATPSPSSAWTPRMSCSSRDPKVGGPSGQVGPASAPIPPRPEGVTERTQRPRTLGPVSGLRPGLKLPSWAPGRPRCLRLAPSPTSSGAPGSPLLCSTRFPQHPNSP